MSLFHGTGFLKAWVASLMFGLPALFTPVFAGAAEIRGAPRQWQLGFQPPGSPAMERLEAFHNNLLLPITVAISLLVLVLLLYIAVRFNKRANPVPSKTAHNTLIEVIWTVLPVMILVTIAIPSFRLLFFEAKIPEPDLTIKAIGNTWRWDYEYPEGVTFTANMTPDDKLKPGEPRLLTTDSKVVVPVNKVVHVQMTSNDVIHSWAVPSFAVKMDAVPGRLNETWFRASHEGIYYGQCSELCGKDHAYMPIEIHVVSEELYKRWLEVAKTDTDKANEILAEGERDDTVQTAAAAPAGPAH